MRTTFWTVLKPDKYYESGYIATNCWNSGLQVKKTGSRRMQF